MDDNDEGRTDDRRRNMVLLQAHLCASGELKSGIPGGSKLQSIMPCYTL